MKNINFLFDHFDSYFIDIRDKLDVTEGFLSDLLVNYNYEYNKLLSSFPLDNFSVNYVKY